MEFQEVSWERAGASVTLRINRPDSLNALTGGVRRELMAGLRRADEDETIRSVVLRGAGRAFSVGQDLKELKEFYQREGYELGALVEQEYIPIVKALRALGKPTIAVLEGAAVGGGMALALAADFRIIGPKAQMVPGFVNVGLAPDTGTTFLLGRSIGYARAVSLCLTGTSIRAQDLVSLGLADSIHETAEDLDEALDRLVERLNAGPTRAYANIRRLFDQSVALSLDQVLELERDVQDSLARTTDHQEAVDAFLDKRTPGFTGR